MNKQLMKNVFFLSVHIIITIYVMKLTCSNEETSEYKVRQHDLSQKMNNSFYSFK